MHSIVLNGIEHWTRRDQFSFQSVLEILRDLHIGIPGCSKPVRPRSAADMGGELNAEESIAQYLERMDAQTNHFFYPQSKNRSPAQMPAKKRRVYDKVFGIPDETPYFFCHSCHEYFAPMPSFPDIDHDIVNSNSTI